MSGTHTEHEDHGWTVDIPDHPARTESPGFRASKTTAHKIMASLDGGLLALLAGAAR